MTTKISDLQGVTPMTAQETQNTKGGFFFLLYGLFSHHKAPAHHHAPAYGEKKGGKKGH